MPCLWLPRLVCSKGSPLPWHKGPAFLGPQGFIPASSRDLSQGPDLQPNVDGLYAFHVTEPAFPPHRGSSVRAPCLPPVPRD